MDLSETVFFWLGVALVVIGGLYLLFSWLMPWWSGRRMMPRASEASDIEALTEAVAEPLGEPPAAPL